MAAKFVSQDGEFYTTLSTIFNSFPPILQPFVAVEKIHIIAGGLIIGCRKFDYTNSGDQNAL